ncbi:MAG TPA: ActS/PrrB/RegB family redox-sensitive histidine kinase [Candidatus Sulfotelmatobacter sp.]|nr:ActS/PrrB/RegB family redox-sensitive histidine kinase [Candidatus Sulfotelmatobacter sp.]
MVAELRTASADPPVATAAEPRHAAGSVRVRTLLYIRWLAIVGQAVALLVVHEFLDLKLPLADCLALLVASILVNLYLLLTRSGSAWLPEHEALFSLGYDVVQLSALLYLTGGLQNPFALLILTPVTVSATILSLRSTLLLGLFVAVAISILVLFHEPLPWTKPGFALPSLYLWGLWSALTFATGFIAVYVSRVAAEARSMEAALTETQIALAREQRLSAVGSLAAAVAHELGSPLGTIAVVATELAHDVPADSALRPDIELLVSQTARCRDILAQLAQARDGEDADSPFETPPLSALVEEVITQQGAALVPIELVREAGGGAAEPNVARQPGMLHSFANLIQNAVQFARTRVIVTIAWSARDVAVTIADDGPGFSAAVLARLGEPYISSRAGSAGHMGLGVFIAQTLLSRTGARIDFGNTEEGGAEVVIRWRRSDIEA